jgi:outer membrane receptor for ferrienterochelin and colicin
MGKHMNKLFNISLLFLVAFTFTSFNAVADEPVDEAIVEVSEVVSEDEESDDEVADVGKVSVTGSRIKRIDLEGATPITVITRAEIDANGYSTVYDAVSNLTQNAGMTNGENYQIGFTPANQVIDLRDFGPGKTLVLVNGKRMADYPFPYNGNSSSFNWGSIPLAAVSRIEVLTAGASSVYGSEAVAGVINVILVDSVERTTVRVTGTQFTQAQDGHGGDVGLDFTTGGVLDRVRYTVALEATQVHQMTTLDRP